MAGPQIDRGKLRDAVRKLGDEYVFYMVDDAIELLPERKRLKLIKRYIDLSMLQPDGEAKKNLLSDVRAFQKASLAGEYYEGFKVNSQNYTKLSGGTRAWITQCRRLLDRCIAEEKNSKTAEVRQAFDIIFGLMDHIDKCLDDVIFFADEGGSWQIGIDWNRVLPPWFRVLSATAAPEEYAQRITVLLKRHCAHDSAKMVSVARKAATSDQRKALTDAANGPAGY